MRTISLSLIVALAVLTGCPGPGLRGNGTIKTESRTVPEFSGLDARGGYEIKWTSGPTAFTISGDENLLSHVKTTIIRDSLRIESDENLSPTKGITITISSPTLTAAQFTGGIEFRAEDVSGKNFGLQSTGAADIWMSGAVDNLAVSLTGASHLRAKTLRTQSATLALVGSSDAEISVENALTASISGAGTLTYFGNPKSVQQQVNGAGTIRRSH